LSSFKSVAWPHTARKAVAISLAYFGPGFDDAVVDLDVKIWMNRPLCGSCFLSRLWDDCWRRRHLCVDSQVRCFVQFNCRRLRFFLTAGLLISHCS
jgi:hypothetical protein